MIRIETSTHTQSTSIISLNSLSQIDIPSSSIIFLCTYKNEPPLKQWVDFLSIDNQSIDMISMDWLSVDTLESCLE